MEKKRLIGNVISGVVGILGSAVLAGVAVVGNIIRKDKKKSDEKIRRAARSQEDLRSPENRLFAGWSQIDQMKYFKAVMSNK